MELFFLFFVCVDFWVHIADKLLLLDIFLFIWFSLLFDFWYFLQMLLHSSFGDISFLFLLEADRFLQLLSLFFLDTSHFFSEISFLFTFSGKKLLHFCLFLITSFFEQYFFNIQIFVSFLHSEKAETELFHTIVQFFQSFLLISLSYRLRAFTILKVTLH